MVPLQAVSAAKRRSFVGSFFTVIRWNEWATSKIPLFLACMYYAALARPALDTPVLPEMAGLLLVLCLYAAFGYAVNSISDREADRAGGKRDRFGEVPPTRRMAFFWAVLATGIALPLILYWRRPEVLALTGFAYLLAAAYSLPPVRFKERGVLGLAAATLAQRTLPAALVFTAMAHWDWAAVGLCCLATIIGGRYIVVHQILDEAADRRAGLRTAATTHGGSGLHRILKRILFPLEVAIAAVTLALIAWLHMLLVPVTIAYLLWLIAQYAALREGDERSRFSVASYYLLEDYYDFYLPVTLAVCLALRDSVFWSVVIFTLLWRTRLIGREWRNAGRVVRRLLGRA